MRCQSHKPDCRTGASHVLIQLCLELLGVPQKFRCHLAVLEIRHIYWKGQVVLQDTCYYPPRGHYGQEWSRKISRIRWGLSLVWEQGKNVKVHSGREAWQRDSRRGEGQDVAREQCGQGDGSQVWGKSTWWLVSRETRLMLTPTSNQRIDWKKTYDTRRAHHSPSFSSESKTSVWS